MPPAPSAPVATAPVGATPVIQNGQAVGYTPDNAKPIINNNGQQVGFSNNPPPSDTVLSNANIIENTIPSLNNKASTLTPDEPTTLATPTDTTSTPTSSSTDYGALYKGAYDSLPDISDDPSYKADVDLINSLKATSDANTNASINSIQKNYLDLTGTLQQSQQASTDKEENALLLGGSARYAPISTGGILDLKTRGDIQQLSTLQDQENQKIAAVKTAQSNQDYQTMSKEMSELDTLRTQKQTLAKSIADSMLKTNQTTQKSVTQNAQDNAIATLVKGGTTDPSDILDALTKAGYTTATAKDVTTTLEGIQKATGAKTPSQLSGTIGSFYSLKAAGELPDSISSLPDNQQLFAFLKQEHAAVTTPKAAAAAKGAAPTKPVISGTLTYTPQDYADDSKALETSRGADGYVDPAVYLKLYNAWAGPNGAGGKLTDFLKTFPVKDYINPANTTLPTYLRPTTTKKATTASTASSADPFAT